MAAYAASLGLCCDAPEICSRYQLSWYDSLIVAAASEADCTILYTEGMKHGASLEGVRIEDAFRAKTKN